MAMPLAVGVMPKIASSAGSGEASDFLSRGAALRDQGQIFMAPRYRGQSYRVSWQKLGSPCKSCLYAPGFVLNHSRSSLWKAQ